jgi:hypothetical protein
LTGAFGPSEYLMAPVSTIVPSPGDMRVLLKLAKSLPFLRFRQEKFMMFEMRRWSPLIPPWKGEDESFQERP